jgi:hypothetical protein
MSINYLKVGAPCPASLGACADLLHDVRELRLEMQRQTDAIEAREKEVRAWIIDHASATDTTFGGQRYVAQVYKETEPTIQDWGVFCAWVRKNDRFDLLQKRLSTKAVDETQETEGRILPGLTQIHVSKVSLTKL